MTETPSILITIGNVYLDHNAFGVQTGNTDVLTAGNEYLAERYETVVGGSAVNFALQVKQLGEHVAFLGRVGDDDEGHEIIRLLSAKGIAVDLISRVKGDITSSAFNMILSHNGEFVGLHWGDASRKLEIEHIDTEHPLFVQAQGVYFGGTAKQSNIFNNLPIILNRLKKMERKIFVDPNRFPIHEKNISKDIFLESLAYIDCYLPNESEIKQLTGQNSLEAALDTVIKKGVKLIVVKCGEKGSRIKTIDEDIFIPSFAVAPITTVGAGDAFNAGFITRLLLGFPLKECARFGNAVAALKVSRNITPNEEEVVAFLKKYN